MSGAPGDPLRVCLVTTSYPRYGGDLSGHFVASLAHAIAELGHEVTVVAPHHKGAADEEDTGDVSVRRFRYMREDRERLAYGDGTPVSLRHPFAWLGLPSFWLSLRRMVREEAAEADIVHYNWVPTAWLAASAVKDKPFVITLHGSDVTLARRGLLWFTMLRGALRRARGVVAVSADQAAFLRAEGLWSDELFLRIIPQGVPDELARRRRGRRPKGRPFTFAYVGRLTRKRGVFDLLDAFAKVERDARLVIVGRGPASTALARHAEEIGLGERVAFEGEVPNDQALSIIASSDALVLPSRVEGSPLSAVEALALGTPVIGTTSGGIPDLLGDHGWLVEPGDVEGLAEAMDSMSESIPKARSIGAAERERVASLLTWPVLAQEIVDLYRESVACGPAPAPYERKA